MSEISLKKFMSEFNGGSSITMNHNNSRAFVYTGADEWDVPAYYADKAIENIFQNSGNVFHKSLDLNVDIKDEKFFDKLLECLIENKIVLSLLDYGNFVYANNKFFIEINNRNLVITSGRKYNKILLNFYTDTPNAADDIMDVLKTTFGKNTENYVNWFFSINNNIEQKEITLTQNNVIRDEYYPFLKSSIKDYVDRFFKSSATVLILIGEPGTGKTSFIRNMIIENQKSAWMTYDEQVMSSDKFFLDFILDDMSDILVIEDADVLLTKRENDNKVMSKLLNVSDGLVSLINKKIIFTTNLTNINSIDPAIIRPGRCFDLVNFRKLERSEVELICDKYNDVSLPEYKKEYSLAELFNNEIEMKQNKVGIL